MRQGQPAASSPAWFEPAPSAASCLQTSPSLSLLPLCLLLPQGASGAVTSEAQRRQAFLQQLRDRLATASADEEVAAAMAQAPEQHLKLLVTKHGMEDWMQVRGSSRYQAAMGGRMHP